MKKNLFFFVNIGNQKEIVCFSNEKRYLHSPFNKGRTN